MSIRLKIVTPSEVKVDESADMVIMRCTTGDMGVLRGHAPCSVILDYGAVRFRRGEDVKKIAVYGGLAMIENDELTILTSEAEHPDEIDNLQAQTMRDHAQKRLREKTDALEIQNDQVLLRRALVQIEVTTSTVDGEDL